MINFVLSLSWGGKLANCRVGRQKKGETSCNRSKSSTSIKSWLERVVLPNQNAGVEEAYSERGKGGVC